MHTFGTVSLAAFAVVLMGRCGTGSGGPSGSAAVDLDQDGFDASVDCNDGDPNINPGVTVDGCNFVDDDCDGVFDEDDFPLVLWFDDDGDSYGDPLKPPFMACTASTGQVENNDDCDDGDAAVNPAAKDVCNYKDDDCDRFVDEDGPPKRVWRDEDGDGYGDASGTAFSVCVPTGKNVENNDDCDDDDAAVNPAAKDVCNYKDDDCDRFVDEDVPPVRAWPDDDADGYGDAPVRHYRSRAPTPTTSLLTASSPFRR